MKAGAGSWAIGIPAAFIVSRLAQWMLFGVTPAAPHVLGLAVASRAGVAALSTVVPALCANRIDPATSATRPSSPRTRARRGAGAPPRGSLRTCATARGRSAAASIVNALVLRPLPYPGADRLVMLFATSPKRGITEDTTSFLDSTAWRTESHAFTDAAAFRQDAFGITSDGPPESVTGLRASPQLLGVLGVTPVIGRAFDEEQQRNQEAVVLISHRLWTERGLPVRRHEPRSRHDRRGVTPESDDRAAPRVSPARRVQTSKCRVSVPAEQNCNFNYNIRS